MHCKDWEERVVLHAGGDLPADQAFAVERHLAGCSGCQVLWSGMKESLDLLHEAHAEPLPAAAYTAVRGRVMAELARRRIWRRYWVAGLAGAAAMLVALTLAIWPEHRVQPLPPVALAIPKAPEVQLIPVSPSPRPRPRALERRVVARRKTEPRQPLLVRLVTDDPNVVLYWIAD